jgi:hypothetical protein
VECYTGGKYTNETVANSKIVGPTTNADPKKQANSKGHSKIHKREPQLAVS